MLLAIVGAAMGGLMTQPSNSQIAAARATGHMTVSGSHTVGGPDGGPGLPGTKWSTEHGDLRVPHFIGLHAVQALAIVSLGIGLLGWPERTRVRAIIAAAASYASLLALLLWRALNGESLVAPSATALAALAIWMVVTAVVIGSIAFGARSVRLTNH